MRWEGPSFILAHVASSAPEPSGFIYLYQGLLVGCLAFVVAATTAVLLWQQINQEKQKANQIKEADYRRTRAKLGFVLSELTDYSEQSARLVSDMLRNKGSDPSFSTKLPLPDLPPSMLDVLSEMVSRAPEEESKLFARFLIFIQVHHSRLRAAFDSIIFPIEGRLIGEHNFVDRFPDAAALKALCDIIFPYARWQADKIDFSDSAINGLTVGFRLNDHILPSERQMVEKKFRDIVRRYLLGD